jgi:diguanylate cyclase (GGDEF)-like protein
LPLPTRGTVWWRAEDAAATSRPALHIRMTLDVPTLTVVLLATLFAISIALPAIMSWRVSFAARCVQGSVIAQALGWLFFLLAFRGRDRLFSTLSMAFLSGSFVLMWHALHSWLGPRPLRWALWIAAGLTPIGYGLGFDHYAFRVGWSNFGLALQMAVVCLALAWPAPHASRRWRALMLICLLALAIVTVWRGVLGAFMTADYPNYNTPHPVNLVAAVLNHVTLVLTTMGLLVAWREEAERELRQHATTDGLTGLLNRRALEQRAADLLSQARRYHDPLSVLLIDLDHFKQINDRHGHAAGDRALQAFARVLRTCLRQGDLACRYGGEEFCVLLSRADADAAAAFDRRLRTELARQSQGDNIEAMMGFSTGLAGVRNGETSLDLAVRRADAALYLAKRAGRGRLVREEPAGAA